METRKTKLTHNDGNHDEAQDPLLLILKKITKLENLKFYFYVKFIFKKIGVVHQDQVTTSKNMNKLSEKVTRLEKKDTKKGKPMTKKKNQKENQRIKKFLPRKIKERRKLWLIKENKI